MLTYFAASKTVDFLIHGIEEYTAVIIISDKSEEIRQSIIRYLRRAVTVYKGRGGLSNTDQDILFCVVTRREIGRIKTVVRDLNESAFIVVHALSDAEGGMVKRLVVAFVIVKTTDGERSTKSHERTRARSQQSRISNEKYLMTDHVK
jgi:uncharacterized membrane-anchored protein YitT (DUF2179 family)